MHNSPEMQLQSWFDLLQKSQVLMQWLHFLNQVGRLLDSSQQEDQMEIDISAYQELLMSEWFLREYQELHKVLDIDGFPTVSELKDLWTCDPALFSSSAVSLRMRMRISLLWL